MSVEHHVDDADRQALESARALIDKRGRAHAQTYASRRIEHLRSIGDFEGADFWERVIQVIKA